MRRHFLALLLAVLPLIALAEEAPKFREWKDATGRFSTQAKFIELKEGVVTLERPSGERFTLSFEKLSKPDKRLIEPLATHVILGKVVAVEDGDTITVLDEEKQQRKIRFEGIDAPELGQAFGSKAKLAASAKVFGKDVRVEWKERDKYDRILGHVYVDDRWINEELVAEGAAWHFKRYSSDERLATAEVNARDVFNGLWADKSPTPPWDFRAASTVDTETDVAAAKGDAVAVTARKRTEAFAGVPLMSAPSDTRRSEPKASPSRPTETIAPEAPLAEEKSVTVYITKTGAKYHSAGCRHLRKSSIPTSLEDAAARYSPCSVCNPPRP